MIAAIAYGLIGMALGVFGTVIVFVAKATSMEKCHSCNHMLTGVVVSRKGGLYCSQLCAIKAAKMESPYKLLKHTDVLAECEEINIDELN